MPVFQLERNGRLLGNHVLDTEVVTIGRARDNTVAIANSAVSRYHARIEAAADGYVLTDLGSLNGTYVNGERIKRVLLTEGDRIEIGEYAIVFLEESSAASAPAPAVSTNAGEPGPQRTDQRAESTDTRRMRETSVIADTGGKRIEVLPEPLESMVHQVESDPETVVLVLRGTVDDANAKVIIDVFDEIIGSGPRSVVVDLSEVATISSTGWGTLLGQQSRLAEMERGMKLAGLHEGLYERFRSLPFSSFFSCYPTVDDAITAFGSDVYTDRSAPSALPAGLNPAQLQQNAEPHTVLLQTLQPERPARHARPLGDTGPSKAAMSLEDKIRCVVSERPFQSEHDIRARLRDDEYGRTEIGRFKLKAQLKKLDLHTKLKRYRFFLRS